MAPLAGGSQPAPFAVGGTCPAVATPQTSQWHQPFTISNTHSTSSNTLPQPFTLGSSNSNNNTATTNSLPQPFTLGSTSSVVPQPFTLSSSDTQQQPSALGINSMQQQSFIGSRTPVQQPFTLTGGAPQPWQQQQQQAAPAPATALSSLDQALF